MPLLLCTNRRSQCLLIIALGKECLPELILQVSVSYQQANFNRIHGSHVDAFNISNTQAPVIYTSNVTLCQEATASTI